MGTESWLSSLWWNSRKSTPENDKASIGVLAFEVASLMSRVANLWHFLGDNEIHKLREEIADSIGIQKVVSEDADYAMDLELNEIMENFGLVSRSVGRLGRKCIDPLFRHFEHFVSDPVENNLEWVGWEYRLKKMERKVKKMERFVAVTMQLSQEHEVLAELEQTLRRMRANPDFSRRKLLKFQEKVIVQRQEVMSLREMSPWIRTYDYIVRLLARSLLTILQRIMHVFDIRQLPSAEENNNHEQINPTCLPRSRSFSILMRTSIHPSENVFCLHPSGPLGRLDPKLGRTAEKNKKHKQQLHDQTSTLPGKHPHMKTSRLAYFGSFNECMINENESSILRAGSPVLCQSMRCIGDHMKNGYKMENLNMRSFHCDNRIYCKLALFSSKHGLLDAPPSTLGHAGLALHYANVIVFIEKLASSPHMIDSETREELYNMLTTAIRGALRTRLKAYGKFIAPSANDASFAAEWSRALTKILEWLSPLAHNMIRWHSERNFGRENEVSRTNVLLVQTLHYANQAKTEVAIIELLVGLSYICRTNQWPNEIGRAKSSQSRVGYSYMEKRDSI